MNVGIPITPFRADELPTTPIWLSTFLTKLELTPLEGREFRIEETFDFESQVLRRILTVPIGTTTDFASIPWFLRWIWAPTGWYSRAAALHDGLCRDRDIPCTFEEAAAVFYEALELLAVGRRQRVSATFLYLGVYYFGRSSFQTRRSSYKGGLTD